MPYILIDRGQMAITHKHPNRDVLNALSWLECTNAGAVLCISNAKALMTFTAFELQTLYFNATGAKITALTYGLAQAVLDAASRMPDTVADIKEVCAQAACVGDGDKSCFKYAPGKMKPEQCIGLFEPPAITVPRMEAEEIRATKHAAPAYHAPTYTPAPAAPGNAGAHGVAPPLPQRAPSAPKAGGVREIIFAAADEAWAAAGSTRSTPAILAMRKALMLQLEAQHGIKRTTSSTALGDWQKSRVL